MERDGVRVGFVAVDSIGESPAATRAKAGTNRLNMPPRTGPLDRAALRHITSDIRALDKQVDVVIVLTHWGTQYTHRPESSQRLAALAFAEAGADLVIGGHPHWVQGWEMAGSALVVHSLGNFVFDMDFQTKTREGIFLEIVLRNQMPSHCACIEFSVLNNHCRRALDELTKNMGATRDPREETMQQNQDKTRADRSVKTGRTIDRTRKDRSENDNQHGIERGFLRERTFATHPDHEEGGQEHNHSAQ